MCLLVFSWQQHERYSLVVAGNRDEYHQRPTDALQWWPDRPQVLAGRDLQAGGTWLGLSRSGRFAAVTNFREAQRTKARARSRGHLVSDFLVGSASTDEFASSINGADYDGFNLLLCDGETLHYVSNRNTRSERLQPGLYGLSNEFLDTPWHKVEVSKMSLRRLLDGGAVNETGLFRLLVNRDTAPVSTIESGTHGFEFSRAISAPFIVSPTYGTRSSSVLLFENSTAWRLEEKRFNAAGVVTGHSQFSAARPDR